jgi:hypothetical protein
MAASTATDYTNSRASNSEKFSRLDLVRASDLPERYRSRLARLMEQFNFTGDELWMATESCRIAIGRVCIRRKAGVIVRVRKGREETCTLGPCKYISRRSVQRMLDDLVEVFGVLEVVYEANQWVPYGGDVVFRHSRTYRLRAEKLKPQETFKEWRMQQKAAHTVAEFPRKTVQAASSDAAPAAAAPLLKRDQPAAQHEHRGTERAPQPKLTKRDCAKFVANMAVVMKGCTHSEYGTELEPGDPRYRPKLSWRAALSAVCERWHRTEESVIEALKFWGYEMEASP